MSTRKTFILGLVLAVAVLYLTKVLLPGREQREGARKALAGLNISGIDNQQAINQIDVSRRLSDGKLEQLSLVKKPAGEGFIWSLPAKRGAVLDTSVISDIERAIRELAVDEPISERDRHGDLSVYGLDKPELTIIVNSGAANNVEVAFGKENEYLSQRYVKISGRPGIFLVPEASYSALNKGSSDVRSKSPIKFNTSDVRELVLTAGVDRIKILQPAVGEWRIVEPRELAASKEAVEKLLNSLQGITVQDFVDVAPETHKEYGLSSPKATVEVVMRGGLEQSEFKFDLASVVSKKGDPELYYLRSNGVDSLYKLSSDPSSQLIKKVNDLRERAIVNLTSSVIESVTSSGSGITPTKIASSGLIWNVNGKDGDPIFLEQYLKDLSGLKADEFPEVVPPNAFEPKFLELVVVTKGSESQSYTLTVGREFSSPNGSVKEPLRYVKYSKDSSNVYAIRDVEAKRLIPHEEALVAKAAAVASGTAVAGK